MTTQFPSGLDQYAPVPRNQAVAVKHHDRHQNVEDAIEAIEVKVGINGSADTSSLDYKVAQLTQFPSTLDGPTGSSLVGFLQSGVDAVQRTVQDKLREYPNGSVEDFGAVGDGVTDDRPAILAMHAALGYVRLQNKTYFVDTGLQLEDASIFIFGAGKPVPNGASNGLQDGSGSIIVGSVLLRSSNFILDGFGVDVGNTRGFGSLQEGIVADAIAGTNGNYAKISNISSMGDTAAVSSHALLTEGFDRYDISDVDVFNHNFGVVVKSRNGTIRRVRGQGIKTAVVYPKSSLPAQAGNVLSGTVDSCQISDVKADASVNTGIGVWVQAEGAPATRIEIARVVMTGGRCAVRVSADGAQYVASVSATDIMSDSSVTGFETIGQSYEVRLRGVQVSNPTSNEAFQLASTTTTWRVEDLVLSITNGALLGTNFATFGGTGQWDGITVRNVAVTSMNMAYNFADILGGNKSGNVTVSGEGNCTLQNGAIAKVGEITPQVRYVPGNGIQLTGSIDPTSASAQFILSLPGTLSFGLNKYFQLVGKTPANVYQAVSVVCSGANMTVLSPNPVTSLDQIDLSGITVFR